MLAEKLKKFAEHQDALDVLKSVVKTQAGYPSVNVGLRNINSNYGPQAFELVVTFTLGFRDAHGNNVLPKDHYMDDNIPAEIRSIISEAFYEPVAGAAKLITARAMEELRKKVAEVSEGILPAVQALADQNVDIPEVCPNCGQACKN